MDYCQMMDHCSWRWWIVLCAGYHIMDNQLKSELLTLLHLDDIGCINVLLMVSLAYYISQSLLLKVMFHSLIYWVILYWPFISIQIYSQVYLLYILVLGLGVTIFSVSWPALGALCSILARYMWKIFLARFYIRLGYSDCNININWISLFKLLKLSMTSLAHARDWF